MALLLVFGEQVDGLGVRAVTVAGVARANAVNLNCGVDGEDCVEESGKGAESDGCKRGCAQVGGGASVDCEGVGGIENAQNRGGEARSAGKRIRLVIDRH